jgi:hypothetical protein
VNLRGLVNTYTRAINPNVVASLQISDGYDISPAARRTPKYLPAVDVEVQVQALTFGDIQQLDGLNIEGVRRAVYMTGQSFALVRDKSLGGDIMTFPAGVLPEGNVWLVAHVLERWPDWCKLAITLQNGS